MDGPNVNWDVLNKLGNKLIVDGFSKTLNIGSCAQHVAHGAFQTGSSDTGWSIKKILKRNLENCFRDRYISLMIVLKLHLFSSFNVFKFSYFLEFTLVTNNQIKFKN